MPLGDAIRDYMREAGVKKASAKTTKVFDAWCEGLNDAEREHAEPVRFQRGTLTVEVDSGVFMHELKNCKNEIYRQSANQLLGEETIKKVVFRLRG